MKSCFASRSRHISRTVVLVGLALAFALTSYAQNATMTQLAELISLKDKIKNPDTRTRVDAFHRVWVIGLESDSPEVKLSALDLLKEPIASASDHIRMPAIYAVAGIANSTDDLRVRTQAVSTLREPMVAGQLPVRIAAIDALNDILRWNNSGEIALEAVKLLGEPLRSGNNGVRIPAINAVVCTVERSNSEPAYNAALDELAAPLDSSAMIGGMEVRMMAVVAVERIGIEASDVRTKAKAMGMMQSSANKVGWEPEAKKRAAEAAMRIERSSRQKKPSTQPSNPVGF